MEIEQIDDKIEGITLPNERTAYRLGQLAYISHEMETVLSPNIYKTTTIRLYGNIRALPAIFYARVLESANVAVSKLRYRRDAEWPWYEQRVDELVSLIDITTLNPTLTPKAAIAFSIGFSAERMARRAPRQAHGKGMLMV